MSETPYFLKESREDIDLAHTHEELEKKKSRFSRLFSRRKNDKKLGIVEEPDTKMTAEKDKMIQDTDVESKDTEKGKEGFKARRKRRSRKGRRRERSIS